MDNFTQHHLNLIRQHLDELKVHAQSTKAEELKQTGETITYCGVAASWEESCTINTLPDGSTQIMIWFNVHRDTYTATVVL